MNYRKLLLKYVLILLGFVYSNEAFSQIEKVVVETYYISDANDATDTIGGYLEPGSTTYRVYIDLLPGSKIQKIYGDANHELKISSTLPFFNNLAEGQTFGKDFSKTRLSENTVALDTWLTIGQVTKTSAKVVGVPKNQDQSGSFIGGSNNDGGSAAIAGGLLTASNPLAGVPLTTSDGNDTMTIVSGSWFDYGIKSTNGDDSTIFGSIVSNTDFVCNNCGIQYAGFSGWNADSNYVLLAQLTTKGELQFELNVEVLDTVGALIKYVANDSILLQDEVLSRYLKFPFEQVCGCPDPNYIEYLADRDCDSQDSCKNIVVFGCMDPDACNYNSDANINVPSLCCYPGKCSDRDLAIVCPQLINERGDNDSKISIYPNPSAGNITFEIESPNSIQKIAVYNYIGERIYENTEVNASNTFNLNLSGYKSGFYFVRLSDGDTTYIKSFTKK